MGGREADWKGRQMSPQEHRGTKASVGAPPDTLAPVPVMLPLHMTSHDTTAETLSSSQNPNPWLAFASLGLAQQITNTGLQTLEHTTRQTLQNTVPNAQFYSLNIQTKHWH